MKSVVKTNLQAVIKEVSGAENASGHYVIPALAGPIILL
jgi:hypothetical protein